jgi:superoxide dismutase, Fe-Mn family
MTRRQALKTTALLTAIAATAPRAITQTTHREWDALNRGEIPFQLPPLPYPVDALEPHIDAHALEIHYAKHHAAYVSSLNKAIAEVGQFYVKWKYDGYFSDGSGEIVVKHLNSIPEKLRSPVRQEIISESLRSAIRDNAGGHYHHSLFWQMMKKKGGGEPKGELAEAITKAFRSFAGFKNQFTQAALAHVGSGWMWLTLDAHGLRLEALPNEDSPLSFGRPVLLGLDLWEHSYYLQYQNRRAQYVDAWWHVVDWDFVAERYAESKTFL